MIKEKLKIAYVITSLEIGGAEKVFLDLVEYIRSKDVTIKVFIIKENKQSLFDDRLAKLGVEYVYLNKRSRLPFDIITTSKLYKTLKEFNPSIIHSHLKVTGYIAIYKLFNRRTIWIHTTHTLANVENKYFRKTYMQYLYRNKTIIPVAVSNSIQKSIVNTFKLTEDVRIINNGINLIESPFPRKDSSYFTIAHIGRFEPVKNHYYIISEFKKFFRLQPLARLTLIGDGSLREKVMMQAAKYELTGAVNFISVCDNPFEILKKTDVFILPSHYEGMPLVLLEAMNAGCVIIASNVSGNKDLIKERENGFLIDNNSGDLCERLVHLHKRPYLLAEIGMRNQEKVKEFSVMNMGDKYWDLYNEL